MIPNIRSLIAPVLTVAYYQQASKGDINFKTVPSFKCGLWHSAVCINAQTTQFHTENDCTYTLITVPKQETNMKPFLRRQYNFLFKLKLHENIAIELVTGVTILFSGTFLTHRQHCDRASSSMDGIFFNFASYGTERLYRHIMTLFHRKSESL